MSESWNKKLKGSIVIKGNSVKSTTNSYSSCFGKLVVKKGLHHWKFKVKNYNGMNNNWNLNFGICREYLCQQYVNDYFHGYAWSSAAAYTINHSMRGSTGQPYGNRIKSGDTVDMYLDLNKGRLYYSLNGKGLGEAYVGVTIPKDKYRMALTLMSPGQEVKLISYDNDKYSKRKKR